MTVIAVGHTHTKFSNLLKMIPEQFEVVKVFNGDDHREDGSIVVPNDLSGRDVAMYNTGFVASGAKRAVLLNDDVQHLADEFWRLANCYLNVWENPPDIVGVANLSAWVDESKLEGNALTHYKKQGRQPLFIRTSAFMCTASFFARLWWPSEGNAQVFEKSTLEEANRAYIIPAEWAYDNNIEKYV